MASWWNNVPKTLEEIEALPDEVLTCAQVAKVLKSDPYTIHIQAMEGPYMLGFPVICTGRRVKIPKRPFIRYMKEGITDFGAAD